MALFGDPFRRFFVNPSIYRAPPGSAALLDWVESPSAHILKLNVPGYRKEDIKVQIEDGNVVVIRGEGEREDEKEKEKEVIWHAAERRAASGFVREMELPEDVKVEQIKAQVENGVLTVVIPKETTSKAPKEHGACKTTMQLLAT
ncbi:15.7 kDa heat shock protein, peroxisomal isoform X3 [Andrographis paniculata]|uniref:15.7 kDa heat shock protein, peroxisomal isoform X3 n=1 Tax=Andrographis paniculata TaxID=175694 RepID=UPI0021E7DBB0|nr:15.7 kDa heat shock protein, peroxisomal isoform X3 [Andrographis paniculata]